MNGIEGSGKNKGAKKLVITANGDKDKKQKGKKKCCK